MITKKVLLVPLVVLLGIFIGFHYDKKASPVYTKSKNHKTLKFKQLHTPKYLSDQIINHKDEYIKNRPTPKNENEEIIAYYEDFHATKYDKNPEAYEENGTVYINFNGKPKAVASNGKKYHDMVMMPKLSASKTFISYTWCNEKTENCDVVVKNLRTDKEVVLESAGSVAWHPTQDVLVYDVADSDNGHNFTKSEVYLYRARENSTIQLTDTDDFVEINPIFSKDGNSIYCDDDKSNKLVFFKLWNAQRAGLISALKFYKTSDSTLDTDKIKEQSALFKQIPKGEKFCDKNMNYWFQIKLDKDMESGLYGGHSYPFVFDKNSFSPKQLDINRSQITRSFPVEEKYFFAFNYKKDVDERSYYFRLKSYSINPPFLQGLFKIEPIQPYIEDISRDISYYYNKKELTLTILSAIVIGMILMSAFYTAIIYVYRRKKEFIYYTLMQVSMSMMLLTTFRGVFFSNHYVGVFSLLIAFFATLFTKSFLETKKHLPIMDMLLNIYLVLIVADMIWIFEPILMHYRLYEFFGILYLVIAIIRIKEGFKPAWFYLLGWTGLLLAIALMDYFHFDNFTMFVGVFVEAVMLAWALVSVSGFGREE